MILKSINVRPSQDQSSETDSNQITVVAFQPVQFAQASFLHKNQTLQNVFLISFMAQIFFL